jgi:hypothetical protein
MHPASLIAVIALAYTGPERTYRLDHAISAFAVAADGKRFAVARDGNWIDVHTADTGAVRQSVRFNDGDKVRALALSPDGALVAGRAEGNDEARVWDAATGEQRFAVPIPANQSHALAFSPDGGTLAATVRGGRVWWFDPRAADPRPRSVGDRPRVGTYGSVLAFHPSGRLVAAAAGHGGWGDVWDLTGRRPPLAFRQTHLSVGEIGGLAFSPDGRSLLVAHGHDGLDLVEIVTGGRRWGLSPVLAAGVTFSPDGRWVASYADGVVRLVDADTGVVAGPLRRHDGCQAIGVGGGRLFTAGAADVRVWHWPPAPPRPVPADRGRLRSLIRGNDPHRAFLAIRELAAAPADAVELARGHVRPVRRPDPATEARIRPLVADLARDEFDVREAAGRKLLGLLPQAGPELLRAARAATDPEVAYRLQEVLKAGNVRPADADPAVIRCLELLERVNTPAARAVVWRVAGGDPGDPLTQDAADTLGRMVRAAP